MRDPEYFNRFEETIDATTAMQCDLVTEVLPHDAVLASGHEIARMLAGRSETYRRLQKQTLNQRMRRRILEGVPYGMALEGLMAARLGRS